MRKPFLECGKIVSTHGVLGEMRVQPWCDSPEDLEGIKTLYFDGGAAPAEVLRARAHKNVVLLKLRGVDTVEQAQALGFGRSIGLAEGLTVQSGALPGAEELTQSGQLANFSFGQGSLLATPLQVAAMMNTIANGGVYRAPCLLDCALDETSGEELSAFARPQAERVLTEQTAAVLRTMLEQTVAEGTAQDASGLPGGAAGKTGTAQTSTSGISNGVFVAFAPYDDPQIAVAVVIENGYHGYWGAAVAKAIFDEYFFGKTNDQLPTAADTLLP